MFKIPDPFALFTLKRVLRINLFLAKWLMRLLSATIELYFRRNFGRRYLWRLILAALLSTVFLTLPVHTNFLTHLFLASLYPLVLYHAAHIFTRRTQGIPEPHTFSAGDSWPVWRRIPCTQNLIQRYIEPGLCMVVSLPLALLDPPLHAWITGCAVALFIKEQISRLNMTRRVFDSMDARQEAQALNAALQAYQQPATQAAQKPHRAHLAGMQQRRNP